MHPTMEPDRKCPRCGAVLPADAPEGLCPACLANAAFGTEPGSTAAGSAGHGTGSPPPTPEEIARRFPQLEILELIGQGGMGIVYKARQTKLDRIVALKILPIASGRDPAFAERFAREARTLARLNHPNIVAIYDFGEADGLFYFLMEFVDGLNLRELEQARQLTAEQALAVVPKICDALQFAHEEGVVHRDIKPGNILIDRKGRVKIADFGLAKLLGKPGPDVTLTGAGHRMGTPHYMAPEQIDRPQLVDHRADIYSLGVVFYEMLTGELPVGRFAPPSQKVHVDVRLDEVVLRALENNPERRYQQASDVKTDVESITSSQTLHAQPATSQPTPTRVLPTQTARAEERVRIPGFALTVYAIVNLVFLAIPIILGLTKVAALFSRSYMGGFPVERLPMTMLPLPVLFLASQICLLIGAARLRDLSSYGWALAAALIALLPTGPLWLVGLGLGIWTLIVIHQPEVRAAFGQSPTPLQHGAGPFPTGFSAETAIPQFSRKAIVGACLLVLPFVLALSWLPMTTLLQSPPLMQHINTNVHSVHFVTRPFWIFLFPLLIGSLTATTILGFAAMKDILYSRGRIVGLPLAIADALLFPLLLLDLLILMLLGSLVRTGLLPEVYVLGTKNLTPPIDVLLIGIILCVLVDYLIVRATWRAARRHRS
jgi:tRNA A-37 threonylcarbamoyl transferase component Bud32